MTREEQLDWLCRLRSEIYVYMPREWLIPMNDALDMSIKDLEQEPKIKVLDRDEAIRKLGAVDIYQACAWITLLNDLEYLGLKICEVTE